MASTAFKYFLFTVIMSVSFSGGAQTLTISNGVQKYGSLASTTVNMSGRCELWATNSSPLSGCTVNLNSADSWLFLPNVKPSVVVSSYLGQVKINGASAVADSNCRVVQYGQSGAVVIPQAASFQPLTVFSGGQFAGTATSYSQWIYYTGLSHANFSSFKLKRGYQAVIAASADGVNYSKCYIAQDGDLEVGVLPNTLDKKVQFIYVTPWRWTAKKGIAGDPGISRLNVNWWYNWDINSSSSRDLEYVAIEQQPFWPGLGQNWQSLGINTLLGYNEPDNSSQDAYKNLTPQGSVTNAVARLPGLLGTGLRIGSPATTDGGRSGWLYPFVSQADAAGYRVDFIAIHYYWGWSGSDPGGAANQMYNFLLDIWNHTHRPIWITEWNNGANWTDNNPYAPPTYAQQQACIAAMTQMLESTPFVERYSLYNWVEDVRSLVTSSNTVTPAGTTYSNLLSNLSYSQTLPDNGTPGIAEFLFATNAWDSSGNCNNGMPVGAPAYSTGHNSQSPAIVLDGTNSYVQLPANMAKGGGFTFAGWINWNGGAAWQRIFDFGNDTSHYLFLTPNSGSSTLRFAINNGSGEQTVERPGALISGSWQHVAVTLNGSTAIIYLNGSQVASASVTIAPSAFSPFKNYFGKSQFAADPLFGGKLDEVEIANYAMTPAQISALYNSAPAPVYTGGIWTNNADGNWSTSNNWSGGMVAYGSGFVAGFSTLDITASRTVTMDSPWRIGGLKFGDLSGAQNWEVSGTNTLTLDAGVGNVPAIAVSQNAATFSAPLLGAGGLAKNGAGTLNLNGTNSLGGGLTVDAGTVNISGGATAFGNGTSTVGYLTGSGNLNVTGGNLATGGELRVGGSDQSGSQYAATGSVTVANATLSVGSLTVARGNYLDNSISGTLTLNGGSTLVSTNDAILGFAGTGRGKLVLNGGNFIVGPGATKWLMVGYYDSGEGEVDVNTGNLFLENGSSLKMCRSGNTGTNVINQFGGNITFYSDAGTSVGGGGNLDLNYAGGASTMNIYNLSGGTLTVPQIISTAITGTRMFNFNGGTLQAAAPGSIFAAGAVSTANVRNSGATIDTVNFNVVIGQPLIHSIIAGDSATDGGLIKNGSGVLTLNGTNSYNGRTLVNNGALLIGSTGSIFNSARIVVNTGGLLDVAAVGGGFNLGAAQVLSGNGSINGTLVNNGTIAPSQSIGTLAALTFSNAPVLNGIVTLQIDRNNGSPQNDQIRLASGTMTCGGNLTVLNVGAPLQAGDTFQLFSAANYGGNFALTNLPSLVSGLGWSNSLAVNGSIAVVSTVSLSQTNINLAVSGDSLILSWPADHTGWRLQAQTNSPNSGLGTNWVDVAGSTSTNTMLFQIDPSVGNVFYRLIYP
jgi:autotransporter-associated beta strand protein